MRRIILASQSPQRQRLLARLGFSFDSIPSEVDEKACLESDPVKRAVTLAQLKGDVVQAKYPDSIIIAADTFYFRDSEIFEKPATKHEAKQMLANLSGTEFTIVTGFYYHDSLLNIFELKPILARGKLRKLSTKEIHEYVMNNPVETWSASLSAAYEEGVALFDTVEGSLTSVTHGLPLAEVSDLLQKSGVV